eukprot:jgi/Pico_ML_1/55764/g1408.t1
MLPRVGSIKNVWVKRSRRAKISLVLNVVFLILLVVGTAVFEMSLKPNHQYIPEAYKWNLAYPVKDNTVPSWSVPLIALLGPFACFLGYYVMYKETWKNLMRETFALVNAVFITTFITSVAKNVVVLIGLSRIIDYRHFWTDVFGGAILGSGVAIFVYSVFYRSPFWIYAGEFRSTKDVVGYPTVDLEAGAM